MKFSVTEYQLEEALKNDVLKKIKDFRKLYDYTKNYFLWTNLGNASQRAYREKQLSKEISFHFGDYLVVASHTMCLSRNNAYRKVCVTINNEEYSMRELTAIKKLLDAKLNNK